jgi:hypothetical protein
VVFEHGHTLPDGAHRALHLAALDEQRLAFRPTLINHDGRALEIWLAGAHSNIGGGYRKDGIGDIVLRLLIDWIEQQTKQHCYHTARLARIAAPTWQPLLTIKPKHLGKIHYQQRRLTVWRDLTLDPRHCCVLEHRTITPLAPKRNPTHPQQHRLLPNRPLPNPRHSLAPRTPKLPVGRMREARPLSGNEG